MNTSENPAIILSQLRKQYPDGTLAVDNLDLTVGRGEVCALVGPSGCGKTTTMRMINRLIEPTSGTIRIDGEDIREADVKLLRRKIGYVIQAVGLFPHYTVRRNVGTVCRLLGWDKERIATRADEMLALVGLDPAEYGDRYPSQLSGGQRQRVGVARALAADPPVLLMDEPFGAVDPIAREKLQTEFHALQQELGTTVVIVTHDIDEAVRLGDRIAVLREGGILAQYDSPADILAHPVDDFVADFFGADRLIKLMGVTGVDDDRLPAADIADRAAPMIEPEATLRQATIAILASPDGRIRVPGDNNSGDRVLTLESIRKLLRSERAS
ncbi:MAG: ATP-binding cassette domain-containing protein [Actinomycetia bacterium]|nr:ATP-binding cassette domain-containing protein [Actinomycetes bacterium]MCH9801417.1 ATP-binding cassette domain-containing protein [Actinomycetes bacterium]